MREEKCNIVSDYRTAMQSETALPDLHVSGGIILVLHTHATFSCLYVAYNLTILCIKYSFVYKHTKSV